MYNYEDWLQMFDDSLKTIEQFYRETIGPRFADLEKRAEALKDKAGNRQMQRKDVDPESTDPSDIAEDAEAVAIDWCCETKILGEHMNGLFCVAIWSLVERFLCNLYDYNKERFPVPREQEKATCSWDGVSRSYKKLGVAFEELDSFDKAETLRLINNVVKHGEGNSLNKLKDKKPDMVCTLVHPDRVVGLYGQQTLVKSCYITGAFADARQFVSEVVDRLGTKTG